MTLPQVVMCSLWRNDAERSLQPRALHLLSKSYPNLRWLGVVGDSDDNTYRELVYIASWVRPNRRVDVIRHVTGIVGDEPETRRRRLGASANVWLDNIKPEDVYCLICESDLLTPVTLVETLLEHAAAGRCPIAGWPILPIGNEQAVFYDIWAYRKDGAMFSNYPPFHACYTPDKPFEVDSVGSCWMFSAADVWAGARFGDEACLTMCATLRAEGRHIWVDPGLAVVQPRELWVPYSAL